MTDVVAARGVMRPVCLLHGRQGLSGIRRLGCPHGYVAAGRLYAERDPHCRGCRGNSSPPPWRGGAARCAAGFRGCRARERHAHLRLRRAVPGTADSAIEVVARLLFRSQGIYTQTQVYLPGIGFVDFLLEGFLIVEIDGSTHLERAQVKKDRGRNNASTLTGYAVLRYGYHDVVHNPQKVVDEVRQVLRGRVIR